MQELISATTPEITICKNHAVTTSLAVSEYFHKSHDNVLKKIRSVIQECSPEYHLVNFNEVVREVAGGDGAVRKMPMFILTRDAFVLIVMGFTGKKALQWKIDYITAFNKMESQLLTQHSTPAPQRNAPADYKYYAEVKDGITTHMQIAKDGETFISIESFREIMERAGWMLVHCDELKNMTIDEFMKIGISAHKTRELWLTKRR